jgi:hypothetical protein
MTFIERSYCADGPPPEIGSGGGSNRQNYMVEGITSKGERGVPPMLIKRPA